MDKRRVRHGFGVAALAILAAAAVAAVLYGLFVLAMTLYLQSWEF